MRKTKFAVALAAAAAGAALYAAEFENRLVRWTLDEGSACVTTMTERESGRELVGEPIPFVAVRLEGGRTNAAVRVSAAEAGGRLVFSFADGGVCELSVTPFDGGWTFEIVRCDVAGLDEVLFVRLKPACGKWFGAMSNIASDERSAVAVRGYQVRTEMYADAASGVVSAGATTKLGVPGMKAGLAAGPRSEILACLRAMTLVADAPHSDIGGAWAAESPYNRGSYLFATSINIDSKDDWFALAERTGIETLHIHCWCSKYGQFPIDRHNFPNGLDDLRRLSDDIHARGFKASMHMLSTSIEFGSPWLTPVSDTNLLAYRTYTLARPLRDGDTEIYVVEQPWDRHDCLPKGRGNFLRIGNELMQYTGVRREPPYAFTGIVRGRVAFADTTVPGEHTGCCLVKKGGPYPAGTKMDYVVYCAWISFFPKADTPLMDKLAAAFANVYNTCRLDGFYFDGIDGLITGHPVEDRYERDRQKEQVFRACRQRNGCLMSEASHRDKHHWWYRSRLWAWDHPKYAPKRFHDLHLQETIRMSRQEDFLGTNLGWWSPVMAKESWRGHFLDEMEYFMCKNTANDVGMSLQGAYVTDGPMPFAIDRQTTLLGWWERPRLANAFAPGLLEKMVKPGDEFRLRQGRDGVWRVTAQRAAAHRILCREDASWTESFKRPRGCAVRILASDGVEPYDSTNAVVMLAASDAPALARRTAPGVTLDVSTRTDAEHGEVLRLVAGNSTSEAVGAWTLASKEYKYPDLLTPHAAFGFWVKGDGSGAVLNLQARQHRYFTRAYAEHCVKLDFRGWRYFTMVFRERDSEDSYYLKWPYARTCATRYGIHRVSIKVGKPCIEAVSAYLNKVPVGGKTEVEISEVRSLPANIRRVDGASVAVNGQTFPLPFALESRNFAELEDGVWNLYDETGVPLRRVPAERMPVLVDGENSFAFRGRGGECPRAEITVFGFGESEPAFRPLDAKLRGALAYEAVMPDFYAPSRGCDGRIAVAVRPGEKARLCAEIYGPVDNPSLTVGGRTWTFPVKLESVNDHLTCLDGRRWKAVHITPGETHDANGLWYRVTSSHRETIGEGELETPLPEIEGCVEVAAGTTNPSGAAARIELVKRYAAPAAQPAP